MKRKPWIFILTVAMIGSSCSSLKQGFPESVRLAVNNPLSMDLTDYIAAIDIQAVREKCPDFNAKAFVVLSGDQEVASQTVDTDEDGKVDRILCVVQIAAHESKILTLRYASRGEATRLYTKRTQAELSHKFGGEFRDRKYIGGQFQNVRRLRVPDEHTDYSSYIRYDGPGWESDKVGYRFYLDWRNAIDIFGKKMPVMVLQDLGQDESESYHEMADWGMDILKVGESLGIGSVGMWVNSHAERVSNTDSVICEITDNGPVYSRIRTGYYGWKPGFLSYNLISELSICAGSRMTKQTLHIQGNPPNLCTGIVKLDSTEVLTVDGQHWQVLATWGKQSLANDRLGMAVLYRKDDLIEITEDDLNHIAVLKPRGGELVYYFLAAWEKESAGIQTREQFDQYLESSIQELDTPPMVFYE
ncbi:DUF4861 domain-containing protein [bacterium]|nr:DUF4861 domain-containing protein [bacterium]